MAVLAEMAGHLWAIILLFSHLAIYTFSIWLSLVSTMKMRKYANSVQNTRWASFLLKEKKRVINTICQCFNKSYPMVQLFKYYLVKAWLIDIHLTPLFFIKCFKEKKYTYFCCCSMYFKCKKRRNLRSIRCSCK